MIIPINRHLICTESLLEQAIGTRTLLELPSHLDPQLADIAIITVIQHTVRKDQHHVIHELSSLSVGVVIQLAAYSSEVHWTLYDLEVVADSKLLRVHWVVEDVSSLDLPADTQYPTSSLLPRLGKLSLLNTVRVDGVGVQQHRLYLGIVFCPFIELCFS